jgi:hypothetical protein
VDPRVLAYWSDPAVIDRYRRAAEADQAAALSRWAW